jgi:hypothetical protein
MLRLATVLLIIGGINWGLIGLFGFDLVAAIFGGPTAILSRIVYCLVGISAIYELFYVSRMRQIESTTTARRVNVDRYDRAA